MRRSGLEGQGRVEGGDDDRCGRCCVPIRRSIIPFANSLSGYVCIDIARVLGAGGVGDLLAGS